MTFAEANPVSSDPYARAIDTGHLRKPVTMNINEETIHYFKEESRGRRTELCPARRS